MPADASKAIQELIAEYEDNQTPEAHLAHDADKIEMLMQAIKYQAPRRRHHAVAGERSRRATHRRGRGAGPRCYIIQPQWWAVFNASYSELRPSTCAHKQLRNHPGGSDA